MSKQTYFSDRKNSVRHGPMSELLSISHDVAFNNQVLEHSKVQFPLYAYVANDTNYKKTSLTVLDNWQDFT